MPYLNPEAKKAWTRDNRDRVNARQRIAEKKYELSGKRKEQRREWYAKNKEVILAKKKEWRKKNWDKEVAMRIKGKFKISIEDFNRMRTEQDNKCPVCTREFSGDVFPNIDHCHDTGVVRGLLCTSCNYAEGFLRNPDNARRMYEYMVKHGLCYNKKAEG